MQNSQYRLLTIGSDVEVPIYNSKTGKFEFAGRYLKGDKHNPLYISDNGHSISVDNVMGEFTIPPVTNGEQLYQELQFCLDWLNSKLPDDISWQKIASANYDPEELKDPRANQFFCDPDNNAWTGEQNNKPQPTTTLRSAGGHIHIGFEVEDKDMMEPRDRTYEDCLKVIRMCDLFLGLPSLIIDGSYASAARRTLYGAAGCFRIKPEYGVEYRTLSNFFIGDKLRCNWIHRSLMAGFAYLNKGNDLNPEQFSHIEEIINTANNDQAYSIIKQMNIPMPLSEVKRERVKVEELYPV